LACTQPPALEVRVLGLEFRVPYGVNNTGPGSGVLPDLIATPTPRIIKTDLQRKVALLPGDIALPLSPFLGIMGVAPPPNLIIVSSGPPGSWGGNLDLRKLTVGATLTYRSSMTARCFTPVIRMVCRQTVKSTEGRWNSP
jgi:acetamidase/formamidase